MSNNQIPGADLPMGTPGATDTVVGVDQSSGELRRFRRDSFPLSAADQARLQALEVGQSADMLGFATKAAVDASLAYPDGTLALVTNDGTAANNGTYRKTGASGVGSWVLSADRVTGLEQRIPNGLDRSGYWGGIVTALGRMGIAFRKSDGRAILGVGGDIHGRLEAFEAALPDPAGVGTKLEAIEIVGSPRSGILMGFRTPAGRLLGYFDSFSGRWKVSGRDTLAEVDALGVRMSSAEAQLGSPLADFPTKDWACWGDSLTAPVSSGDWPSKLAEELGVSVYNGGWGGQSIQQIAARQGGVPCLVTVVGGTIPASGAVTVTTNGFYPASNGGSVVGTLSGVLGTFARASDGLSSSFTRAASGAAVASPAGSPFIPLDAVTMRDRIMVVLEAPVLGQDDVSVSAIRAMVDYLTPRIKRVMVCESPVSADATTPEKTQMQSYNDAIRAAFPGFYVPLASWLRTAAAASAAGITFTEQDNADIANGITPTSFRSDTIHLNTTGGVAVMFRIRQEAVNRGWI